MACFRATQRLKGHKDSVLCCKYHKDCNLIASGGEVSSTAREFCQAAIRDVKMLMAAHDGIWRDD